ncbi:hypothetical protein J0S82_009296 [Galemys pyrenaicus]|uniref:Uncharacterized protein n=1 Tax=Galemys pyrenaicus TaxID=202257 RepID=A0A8J6AVJ5_GALPY|nr:hypothetical protein J0S82_009296 [Galemys pyrenaicus]
MPMYCPYLLHPVITPSMLTHLLMESQAISKPCCGAQMVLFLGLGCSHCFLLMLMV